MSPELLRKLVHAFLSLSLAYLASQVSVPAMVLLGVLLFGVFWLTRRKRHLDFLRQVGRTTYGELYFAGGILASTLLFLPTHVLAFQVGMLVLGLADPIGALVGKRYGRHHYRLWGDRLSYEGSITCGLVSALTLAAFGTSAVGALAGGVVLALVEALSPRGSDNLLLPLTASMLHVMLL